jgi:hypothetical protein
MKIHSIDGDICSPVTSDGAADVREPFVSGAAADSDGAWRLVLGAEEEMLRRSAQNCTTSYTTGLDSLPMCSISTSTTSLGLSLLVFPGVPV